MLHILHRSFLTFERFEAGKQRTFNNFYKHERLVPVSVFWLSLCSLVFTFPCLNPHLENLIVKIIHQLTKKTPITTPLSFCRFLDPLNTPHCSPSTCRDTRAQKEWKVHANTSPARSPTKSWARCFLTQAERLGLTKKQRCYSNKFWITLPIVTSG